VRILVVEDEAPLADALRAGLSDEFYAVDVARDGEEGLWAARSGVYDAIVLDRRLPRVPGIEVCRRLRAERSHVPILMLTAMDTTRDVVAGLDAGANDYLVKPFAFEELLARLRALLRAASLDRSSVIELADLRIDTAAHTVTRAGETVELTAKEFQLLEFLARHRGEVVSKERLGEALWAHDCEPDSNALEVYVANLRRKLERGRDRELLHTVRGAGYVLRDGGA
jgi:DNA-binding response OmpR family regulator